MFVYGERIHPIAPIDHGAVLSILKGPPMTTQTTDHATGGDVTVDTDELRETDLLGRIDEATAAPNGDPVRGSIEAQLKLLLPGTAFVVKNETRQPRSAVSNFAKFMNFVSGGEIQVVDVDGGDEGSCTIETVTATWTTSAGIWAVNVDTCFGEHQLEGCDVKVSHVTAEGPSNDVVVGGLDPDEVITLVRLLCKKGLSYT